MSYDTVQRHLPAAGSIDRAAVPLGLYLAWCANLKLLSDEFEAANEFLLLRLRYREITGSELLTVGCGGELAPDVLSAAGRAFTEGYLDGYLDDFRSVFGEDIYDVEDSWTEYDRLAPVLTRRLLAPATRRGGERRWWQIWR